MKMLKPSRMDAAEEVDHEDEDDDANFEGELWNIF
jgi:hypothetical protein